jgi:hypothetical protein
MGMLLLYLKGSLQVWSTLMLIIACLTKRERGRGRDWIGESINGNGALLGDGLLGM